MFVKLILGISMKRRYLVDINKRFVNKAKKYIRIKQQIMDLVKDIDNPLSRMVTINALLHHKMQGFFWTGFYLIDNGELLVGPYQGTLACILLKKNTGVCWAGINQKKNSYRS